jgi:pterin-4a-carbinolamine dehydratase
MPAAKIAEYLREIPGWVAVKDHHLQREIKFPDFVQALAATNRMGQAEGGDLDA